MTDSTIELILRDIQAQLIKSNARLGNIESRLTAIEGHISALVTSDMRKNTALAELESRIDRIERRLDLA